MWDEEKKDQVWWKNQRAMGSGRVREGQGLGEPGWLEKNAEPGDIL